jgi:type IV secretion system protein VirD4
MTMPRHLRQPRAAYPPGAAAVLPDALAWWITSAFVGAAALSLAIPAILLFTRRRRHRDAARWAAGRELRRLRVHRPERGRLTLGRRGPRLLAAEAGQSVLVVAPTQSGKTTGLAVPAILEWRGPVLATSVKTDLVRDTIAARKLMGRVQLFDPLGETGLDSAGWSPLDGCRDWGVARRTAAWLAESAAIGRHGLADADFWNAAATKLLAPLLFAAARAGASMADVVTWLDTQDEVVVMEILEATEHRAAIDAMQATVARDERQRSSVYTTAETILEAYADPAVLERARVGEISPDALLDGGSHTLYLSSTVREQRRLRPVLVALIQSVIHAAYRRAAATGTRLDPPLLVVLDEAANIAPLPDLDVLAATGVGQGVQVLTVLQDLAQAYDRWGRDRAETIVNNHRAKLVGAGTSDPRTLEWVGRLLGDAAIEQRSSTSGDGRRTFTDSVTYRALAPANVIRQARPGTAVLIHGDLAPAWIRLRPWFSDRRLRRLARADQTREVSRPASR